MQVRTSETQQRRRPGPFGPAWALLPKDQQSLVLPSTTLAGDAIERMMDSGFSQVPITDENGKIVGVFTWESFGRRVADLRDTRIKPTDLRIIDAHEPANFIDGNVYIDTATDWSNLSYVLVGSPEKLEGILTIADVLGRLNDFGEAFVLIYEIEHEIRDLIMDVYSPEQLELAMTSMMDTLNRPVATVISDLKSHVDKNGPNPAIGKALKVLKDAGARPLSGLNDFTFSQYKMLVCSEANWPAFAPMFDTMRELVDADFDRINQLRNVVFHFRRAVTPSDTDRLRRFRDRLRYDRELYAKEIARKSEKVC